MKFDPAYVSAKCIRVLLWSVLALLHSWKTVKSVPEATNHTNDSSMSFRLFALLKASGWDGYQIEGRIHELTT